MSNQHSGNVQPSVDLEEHSQTGGVNAKKVFVYDNNGNQINSFGGNATLNASPNYIGLATVTPASNVTLNPSSAFIGLVTIVGGLTPIGNVTLNPSPNFIGLTTVTPALAWPDPKTFIGLVTIAQPISTTFSGNVTLDAGSKTAVVGNVTLSDSKGFIGLVTVGNTPNVSLIGNITISDPKTFIGSVSVGGIVDSKGYIGLVTTTPGTAWPDPKTYIGLVTITEAVPYSSPSVVIGMISSASGGLVQFPANAIKWADIKASYANVTTVYVGGSTATINNGFPLAPGDTIGMAISNSNQLYLVGVGTSEVRFLGGN